MSQIVTGRCGESTSIERVLYGGHSFFSVEDTVASFASITCSFFYCFMVAMSKIELRQDYPASMNLPVIRSARLTLNSRHIC